MIARKTIGRFWVGVAAALAMASSAAAAPSKAVSFSIIKTGSRLSPESMLYQGGGKAKVEVVYSAILVRHDGQDFLFDTGLGARIDEQYARDMPGWKQPFFYYGKPIVPAHAQLARAGFPAVRRIVLSHSHWDHASGLVDFPGAEIWVTKPERTLIDRAGHGADSIWPSQVGGSGLSWTSIDFRSGPYRGVRAQSRRLWRRHGGSRPAVWPHGGVRRHVRDDVLWTTLLLLRRHGLVRSGHRRRSAEVLAGPRPGGCRRRKDAVPGPQNDRLAQA